jgi:hypothetical protein
MAAETTSSKQQQCSPILPGKTVFHDFSTVILKRAMPYK